jgi:hypothetical protein
MERRDRSIKALKQLIFIDSQDDDIIRAESLVRWGNEYLPANSLPNRPLDFDLELKDLKLMSELFYRNIDFLKKHREKVRKQILENQKIGKFVK